MITQEELKKILTYDPETGLFTRIKTGAIAGGIHKMPNSPNSARYIGINNEKYRADQLAILYMTGEKPNFAYHKDHNQANDIYSNLLPSVERPKYKDRKWEWKEIEPTKELPDPRNRLEKMLDELWVRA